MKKFHFSMDIVLRYREQMLDALRGEHAACIARVHEQEQRIAGLRKRFDEVNEEYCTRKAEGLQIADIIGYDGMLRAQSTEIQKAEQVLTELRHQEERKRAEVVRAKTEKATIELLKDKKLESYRKAEQKSEEEFIDEFVSTSRVMASSAASQNG